MTDEETVITHGCWDVQKNIHDLEQLMDINSLNCGAPSLIPKKAAAGGWYPQSGLLKRE